jgi:uncharacterized protein YecE (DUF72 family)
MAAVIKTGVTSWAERSLIASGWYPPSARTPEARLRHYASRFAIVENDSTYYGLPDRVQAERWSERTPSGFTMNIKAYAPLTGHYTDPGRLPKDLRAALPPELQARPRVYPRHLGPELMGEIGRRFIDALEPLHRSGKLGVVLFQYPVWFPWMRANEEELARVRERFAPYRIAVEFRNATWMSQRHRHETLQRLRAHDIVYVCVDEPQGFVSSLPPIAAATSGLALVRLHGRNAARWSRAARTAAERFDYLYSVAELREWVPRVLELARETDEVHVLFNNCHRDHAVRNASQMIELLDGAQAQSHVPATP